MSLSQRIYRETKARLDKMQARFILDQLRGKRIALPEFVDLMASFIEDHFDEFEKSVKEKSMRDKDDKNAVPAFVQLMGEIEAPGSPEDFEEYNYDDM